MSDLFADERRSETLGEGAVLLRSFAREIGDDLLGQIPAIAAAAPFRHMKTPGGRAMSAAMTSCGRWGWTSSTRGYAYREEDPETTRPWPAIPAMFADLARRAAAAAGFAGFDPDGCLINRYGPGAKMGLHQDRDETDLAQPIVSVSLGRSAIFLWGGPLRGDRPRRVRLDHGDVVVWGGPSRIVFHGVDKPLDPAHPIAADARYNLTFRKAR